MIILLKENGGEEGESVDLLERFERFSGKGIPSCFEEEVGDEEVGDDDNFGFLIPSALTRLIVSIILRVGGFFSVDFLKEYSQQE